ncbi:PadR family transcriptional regulator [Streptomyces polyrhachis]|uniref:PadR family transcriptional regulator n=1 Tax=Streptomyces polyrhachis TaxID=1282885 RepID=A0ABW2GB71_9ACTN
MSIRHGLLALLESGPRYGNQLRAEFEARTGATWPLNVGQVYTTLNRLERDGRVAPDGADTSGHPLYAITESGRAELRDWYATPVDRERPARDELAIKLAMAVGAPDVDIRDVIQRQRSHTLKAMQDYTRLKTGALAAVESEGGADAVAWLLVLENLIFQTEAEVRWLDHSESRLVRLSRTARTAPRTEPPQPGTAPPTEAGPEARTRAEAGHRTAH